MDKIIHQFLHLKCNPDQAFDMFTDNKLLESWLATKAIVEPVESGKYELFWDPNDRENNSTAGCKITKIVTDKFLAFEWRSPKQFKHFANNADPLTQVVVFFIPDENGTEIHLIHSGWRNKKEWDEAREWQERAWSLAFQELKKAVNNA